MATPAPEEIRAARERLLGQWAASASRARRIAAAWGRDLLDRSPDERAESSMAIAKRFGVNNTMAARARRYLLSARFLYRNPQTSRYHVAASVLPVLHADPGPGVVAQRNPPAAGIPASSRPRATSAGAQPR